MAESAGTTSSIAVEYPDDDDRALAPSVDELATLYYAYSRGQAHRAGLPVAADMPFQDYSVDMTQMYLSARRRFETVHGVIVQEYWGEKQVVALLLTENRGNAGIIGRRRGRRRAWEAPIFALHRTLRDLRAPTPFHAAFARGDDLVARTVNVLRSREAQRVVVARVFAAQEGLINALETVGEVWARHELQAQEQEQA